MPSPLDLAFAVLVFIVLVAAATTYSLGRLERRVAEGVTTARRNWYRGTLLGEWAVAAAALAVWSREGRPWQALGLVPPTDWRLYAGVGLAIGVTAVLLRQNASIRGLPADRLDRLAPKLAGVEMIMPHTRREYRWFLAVSWTAGVCEELLYRGFLTWLIASFVGTTAAVVLAAIVFGFAHTYQGPKGIVKTGVVGLVLGGIVLLSGWLVPAMLIHAMIDIAGGVVGLTVLARRDAA